MMTNQNKQLCLNLMHAEQEKEIVKLLADAGYWDDPSAWRLLGDMENNFSTIGNQQSDPVAALVEKIVNAIDARLMGECRAQGVNPASDEAPGSSQEAVARFFEPWHDFDPNRDDDGLLIDWTNELMTKQSRQITVTASGSLPTAGNPSISIADTGEGQTPDAFPDTFMSLNKSNKLRIPFVQGKFNMGGTGALQFCGTTHNFQLVVSRRRPDLLNSNAEQRERDWGFTIVRRRVPEAGARNSVFEYLAPSRAVLSFPAVSLPLMPDDGSQGMRQPQAYGRETKWGTLIKLYTYSFTGDRSVIIGRTGLSRRVEAMLPRAILPLFFVDARYTRHSGLAGYGVQTRLEREQVRESVLEPNSPIRGSFAVARKQLPVTVYAFRPGKASTYRPSSDHAVAFTVNGQTHAWLTSRFFQRQSIRLSYLSKDLFVVVDCSLLDGQVREDLFLNSRDRMRGGQNRKEIEKALEQLLRDDPMLRKLNQDRRDAALLKKIDDGKVTRSIVSDILKKHQVLRRALAEGTGIRVTGPRISEPVDRELKRYPDYFELVRPRAKSGRAETEVAAISPIRFEFDTNADNDYFATGRGRWRIIRSDRGADISEDFHISGPTGGAGVFWSNHFADTLSLSVGEFCDLRIVVEDDNPHRIGSVMDVVARVRIKESPGKPGKPGKPSKRKPKHDDSRDLPTIVPVWKSELVDAKAHGIAFSDETAVEAFHAGDASKPGKYDLYIYMNNKFLDGARGTSEPHAVTDQRWIAVMTLLSMGCVVDRADSVGTEEEDVDSLVRRATRSLAPSALHLGEIFAEDIADDSE